MIAYICDVKKFINISLIGAKAPVEERNDAVNKILHHRFNLIYELGPLHDVI